MFNYNLNSEGTLETRYYTKADSQSINRNLSGELPQKNVTESIKKDKLEKIQ